MPQNIKNLDEVKRKVNAALAADREAPYVPTPPEMMGSDPLAKLPSMKGKLSAFVDPSNIGVLPIPHRTVAAHSSLLPATAPILIDEN